MCDRWIHIYCNNICKKTCHTEILNPVFKIPFSCLNHTELTPLSKGMSVLPKRKDKLPTTIFKKLNVFTENEDIKCKYHMKDWFKGLGFDKNSK